MEVRAHPFEEGRVVLRRNGDTTAGGVSLGGGSFPEAALLELSSRDLVKRQGMRSLISAPGQALLRRCSARDAARNQVDGQVKVAGNAFADQHRAIRVETLDHGVDGEAAPSGRVRVNQDESPLVWLAARKNADGETVDQCGPVPGRRALPAGISP